MDSCVVSVIEMKSKWYGLKWNPMIVIEIDPCMIYMNDEIDIEILYDNS